MAKILTGQLRTVPGVYYAVAQKSRVISMVAVGKVVDVSVIAVSEPLANPFRILGVWVRVYWEAFPAAPIGVFRITTGVGQEVDVATVYDWERVIPLRYANAEENWRADHRMFDFWWTMRRAYTGQGRRIGVWWTPSGFTGVADCMVSVQIEEG